jgi:hypothetical protein
MAMIRHAYVAKEGFAGLMGVLMAQGVASAERKIIISLSVDSASTQESQRARLLKK